MIEFYVKKNDLKTFSLGTEVQFFGDVQGNHATYCKLTMKLKDVKFITYPSPILSKVKRIL